MRKSPEELVTKICAKKRVNGRIETWLEKTSEENAEYFHRVVALVREEETNGNSASIADYVAELTEELGSGKVFTESTLPRWLKDNAPEEP